MPIYGKGRTIGAKGRVALARQIKHKEQVERDYQEKEFGEIIHHIKRRYTNYGSYEYERTPLISIQKILGIDLEKAIQEKCHLPQGLTKPVIVDWGCGAGTSITELAKKFHDKAHFYGFGDVFYEDWRRNEQVKFVHGIGTDFPRYFKKNSIDIIYSFSSLSHEFTPDYMKKILPALKIGGIIITDVNPFSLEREFAPKGFTPYGHHQSTEQVLEINNQRFKLQITKRGERTIVKLERIG
jgi:SAM-dependent methyltransferase